MHKNFTKYDEGKNTIAHTYELNEEEKKIYIYIYIKYELTHFKHRQYTTTTKIQEKIRASKKKKLRIA